MKLNCRIKRILNNLKEISKLNPNSQTHKNSKYLRKIRQTFSGSNNMKSNLGNNNKNYKNTA